MVVPGAAFCGNHLAFGASASDEGAAALMARKGVRVPCPLDPSHTVLEAELEQHVASKCPTLRLVQRERAQPHFLEDVNAGSDTEPDLPPPLLRPVRPAAESPQPSTCEAARPPLPHTGASTCTNEAGGAAQVEVTGCVGTEGGGGGEEGGRVPALGPFQKGRAGQRAALARRLGEAAFMRLVAKLEAAYDEVCGGGPPPARVLRPPECEAMLGDVSNLRPFDLKHGLQQASIVGNMQRVGLLEPGPQGGRRVAVVELGAGKGYLGGTLVEAAGVERLVATDIVAGLRLKADRHLRHIVFGRHRVDLKDYVPAATPELWSRGAAAAAPGAETSADRVAEAGKECASRRGQVAARCSPSGAPAPAAARRQADVSGAGGACAIGQDSAENASRAGGAGAAESSREGTAAADGGEDAAASGQAAAAGAVKWVAVAKHLCGAATDYGLRACLLPHDAKQRAAAAASASPSASAPAGDGAAAAGAGGINGESTAGAAAVGRKRRRRSGGPGVAADGAAEAAPASGDGGGAGPSPALLGLAIAPCCHHRCGWRAYTGKGLFRRLGLTAEEFELSSWMTGWALCGHDTPAGVAPVAGDDEPDEDPCADGGGERAVGGAPSADAADGAGSAGAVTSTQQPLEAATSEDAQAAGSGQVGIGAVAAAAANEGAVGAAGAAPPGEFDPAARLPRARRMAIGAMAKQLIDAGRLDWLTKRYGRAELVSYIGPEVTGENRLLLAVGPCAGASAEAHAKE
ncbi:hypothetical protein HYH03_013174 [Edaphochlamys debaryana]|uniref:tRNA:m(4)X modification enzyme TRM13 n=1 Tax=Edaphochlamys debaryana TaxID=47281 RepID=A0A835XRB8_9CHLO|nr:hypothetical protein HYH03_013174 [Edaphochlamys debaryana]|eukprot:KAG2488324.1 hypothetical protein HYH03_013174 [Edaphochlamys debaryana]